MCPVLARAPRRRPSRSTLLAILSALSLTFAAGVIEAAETVQLPAATRNDSAIPKRTYVATRLTTKAPEVDGKIDDTCWSEVGRWTGDYTEHLPRHGVTPDQPTQLKVLYDDKYLYIAIRAFDTQSRTMNRFAGSRDAFVGDIVGICFDSYLDYRHGFEFDLTSAGQKIDLILSNDGFDTTWNPVWDGKVSHDPDGWTAEMRVPLSQLRYNDRKPQVWGMHAWRWLARQSSESQWQLLPNDGTGVVYNFGELHGLELPKPRRHLEVIPYASGKYTQHALPDAGGNSDDTEIAGGADAKLQLSTSFTLDATINPDFGQVEADPSEMNLTAFETFLSERRTFFIEGKDIFSFSLDGNHPLFYSRRIGQAPSVAPRNGAYDFASSTSILGAWKVTGKSSKGLSLGVLHAVTDKEHAHYRDETGDHTQQIEPAAQYAVARLQQDLNGSNTIVGGIVSAAKRSLTTDELANALPEQAVVAGLDFEHYWNDRTYWVGAKAIGSHVTGTPAAISALQTSSARYYQRPDADHIDHDPSRTALNGWGVTVDAGKRSKGNWRYHGKLLAYSPGLEFNDLGYLREADRIRQHADVSYVERTPGSFYRDYELRLEGNQYRNFDGEHLRSEVLAEGSVSLTNNTFINLYTLHAGEALDTVALRGGPSLRVPPLFEYGGLINTDSNRRWQASLSAHQVTSEDDAYSEWHVSPTITFRPTSAVSLSLSANRSGSEERRHYVWATDAEGEKANVVSRLQTDSMVFTARAQWFVTPELSVQYYGSPFGSTGAYSDFEEIVAPRASSFTARGRLLGLPSRVGNTYGFDENGDGRNEFSLERPDFSFGQFRSNLVVRWEFRPGSNLYVIWSQDRSGFRNENSTSSAIIRGLAQVPDTNVLMVKCSYWFSL